MEQVYEQYETRLEQELLRLCTSLGKLSSAMLVSEDIESRWKEMAPDYMADALPQIAQFPEAAIAWAGYLGMAVAHQWDEAWDKHHNDS